MPEFTPIREPYLHGYQASRGNLTAEVVRCYEGEWTTFFRRDGRIVVTGEHRPTVSKEEAMRLAKDYLSGRLDLSHLPLARE